MFKKHKIVSDGDKKYSKRWFKMADNRRLTRFSAETRNLLPRTSGGSSSKDYKAKMFHSRMVLGRGRFILWFGYLSS
jgi:hypothetical protein